MQKKQQQTSKTMKNPAEKPGIYKNLSHKRPLKTIMFRVILLPEEELGEKEKEELEETPNKIAQG